MIMPKKSSITCLSDVTGTDLSDHRARLVLAEKAVSYEVEYIDLDNPGDDFLNINPYHTLPVLIDRDLVLNQANIIIEYLDERFPHPPLLPVYPVSRAKTRLMIYRIEQDWYPLVDKIRANPDDTAAKTALEGHLLKMAPAFKEMPYFLSQEFSLVDCTIAPILWRLPELGIELPEKAEPVKEYAQRLFQRESFKLSLSEAELEMNDEYYG
ncbi:MAG: stringent starvation protein A [Legionellales bacterium]|jgi:RNA polymerase-associated protein|nr:stringent starvation protein A [Legionellales bacterium]HAV94082.1 stringent starvation protein A [Pseudomonadota bacterium]